jgi:DNA-binding beta-propeller fold protein YncE
LAYLGFTPSATFTFNSFPGFTYTLPSSISTAGESFYIAYLTPGASAWVEPAAGPASVSGQTLTFAPDSVSSSISFPITLTAGDTYGFALYDVASSPSPSPSPSPTVSPSSSSSPGTTLTIAGNPGMPGSSNGTGTNGLFRNPAGIAFDPSDGNLYVADTANCMVRRVTTLGAVTTVAGSTSVCGFAGIYPSGIAYDSTDGNLYVTNEGLCNVDQIMMNGTITSIAGNAESLISPCSFGDGTGTGAHFDAPIGIAYDAITSDLYVTDALDSAGDGCAVRQVTTAGAVVTIAGGPSTCGPTSLLRPEGVAYDPTNGNLYVTDWGNCAIRQVTTTGVISLIAGNPGTCGFSDGSGANALFNLPVGIAYDSTNQNLYVTDTSNCAIRQVTIAGAVTTIAGNHLTCGQSPTWANGTGPGALFYYPEFITYDSANDELYVTDTSNDVIRQIKP